MRCRLYSSPCLLLRVEDDWYYLSAEDYETLKALAAKGDLATLRGERENFQQAYDLFEEEAVRVAARSDPAEWVTSAKWGGAQTIKPRVAAGDSVTEGKR